MTSVEEIRATSARLALHCIEVLKVEPSSIFAIFHIYWVASKR